MVKKYLILSIQIILTVFLLMALVKSISQAAQAIAQPTLPAEQSSPDPQQWINRRKLHPDLVKTLSSGENIGQIPIIIEWGGQSYAELLSQSLDLLDKKSANRLQARTQVIASLEAYASEQSGALRTSLQAAELLGQASDIHSFWVSPIIAVKATPALIADLTGC